MSFLPQPRAMSPAACAFAAKARLVSRSATAKAARPRRGRKRVGVSESSKRSLGSLSAPTLHRIGPRRETSVGHVDEPELLVAPLDHHLLDLADSRDVVLLLGLRLERAVL